MSLQLFRKRQVGNWWHRNGKCTCRVWCEKANGNMFIQSIQPCLVRICMGFWWIWKIRKKLRNRLEIDIFVVLQSAHLRLSCRIDLDGFWKFLKFRCQKVSKCHVPRHVKCEKMYYHERGFRLSLSKPLSPLGRRVQNGGIWRKKEQS